MTMPGPERLLVQVDKRFGDDLVNVYKYLIGGSTNGARLFSGVSSDRTGGNGHKYLKFHLNTRRITLFSL